MRAAAAGLSVSETLNVFCALRADPRETADKDAIGEFGAAIPVS